MNKTTIEKNGDSAATKPESYICNGPFYISEWVPSSYIVFTKNPNYRDASSIKLDSIKLLLMEDPSILCRLQHRRGYDDQGRSHCRDSGHAAAIPTSMWILTWVPITSA